MRKLIIAFSFLILLFVSCDLFEDDASLKVAVFNLDNWSPENSNPEADAGITVKLYKSLASDQEVPFDEAVTGSDGEVEFKVPDGEYWIRIDEGTSTNLIEKEQVSGLTVGLVIVDFYHSEVEVAAAGLGGYVGGPVFLDQNGDRVFNSQDKVRGSKVSTGSNNKVFIITE
ncbi:MAG: hypothetical protein ACK5M7_16585 [Draconibacterium sp.]